jgi:hypothetical protein
VFLALIVATGEAIAVPASATVERDWKRIFAVRKLKLDKPLFAV